MLMGEGTSVHSEPQASCVGPGRGINETPPFSSPLASDAHPDGIASSGSSESGCIGVVPRGRLQDFVGEAQRRRRWNARESQECNSERNHERMRHAATRP